jgi:hypothetical protein
MKTFSGSKSHDVAGRQTAQGYAATNIVIPGLGSLTAGRKVGLIQLCLYLTGFGITLVFGTRFVFWALAHWSEFHNANLDDDPWKNLRDLLEHACWPLLGIILFVISWLWALLTSRSLLLESKNKSAADRTDPP